MHCILEQAWYFDRDDVALKGFHKFFSEMSKEEREHAEKLLKYQNRRGGKIVLENVNVSIMLLLAAAGRRVKLLFTAIV